MTEPTFIETEFSHGKIANCDYGSRVRVLLRSPTAVLFTGVGLNIWSPRGSHHSGSLFGLGFDRVTKEVLGRERNIAAIDKHFGEGAHKIALEAWTKRGLGTALIDGGGEPMPLPFYKQKEVAQSYYDEHGVDWKADLTGQIKTCRQCGKPLTPDTDHHRFGPLLLPEHPKSLEECQRLTNRQIIALHGYGPHHKKKIGYVAWFEVWDGETYHDEFFCHGKTCAAEYGRRAVRELAALEVGVPAPKDPYRIREDTDHAPEREEKFMTGPDGKMFRI